MNQKLPADPIATILGIISLILGLNRMLLFLALFYTYDYEYHWFGRMSNKSIKKYNLNSEIYSTSTRTSVGAAKVLNSIALVLSILFLITLVVRIIYLGSFLSTTIWEELKKNNDVFEDYEWEQEEQKDSVFEKTDTLRIETIEIDEVLEH